MAKKKKKKVKETDRLKWETARDLRLQDDLINAGDNLTTREAGKLGGQMVRKLTKKGKEKMAEETQDVKK